MTRRTFRLAYERISLPHAVEEILPKPFISKLIIRRQARCSKTNTRASSRVCFFALRETPLLKCSMTLVWAQNIHQTLRPSREGTQMSRNNIEEGQALPRRNHIERSKNAMRTNHTRTAMGNSSSKTPWRRLIIYLERNSQTSPHNVHARHPSHSIPSWTKSKFIVCIDLWIHRDSMPPCPNVNPSAPYAPYGEPMRMHSYKHKAHSTNTNLPPSATHTRRASRLFLLLLGSTLDLCRTPESLLSVLALLA